MASYTNLTALFTAIATSIRNKGGTTDTIKPVDFPDKIDALPSGGGSAAVLTNITTSTTSSTGIPFVSTEGTVTTTQKITNITIPSGCKLTIDSNAGTLIYAGWQITVLDSGELSFKKVS